MTTTAQELSANIGKTATLKVAGTSLAFEVTVMDARKRYGNLDYKVKPVAGGGEAWHQSTALIFPEVASEHAFGEHVFDEQAFGSNTGTDGRV